MKLIDQRTANGSRYFSQLANAANWSGVRDHTLRLPGVKIANCVEPGPADPWLDFFFRGHRFVIHGRQQSLHLFVDDPQCSDLILYQVGRHFEQLAQEADER
ncbi:MAG: hypothetical protein ABFC63_01655 [Thermoguttaceae bacterium]